MPDNVELSPEEQELLRAVVRKRQPSTLWIVTAMKERPLTPAQRDNIRALLTDEMREAGSMSERGTALKALIDRLGRG